MCDVFISQILSLFYINIRSFQNSSKPFEASAFGYDREQTHPVHASLLIRRHQTVLTLFALGRSAARAFLAPGPLLVSGLYLLSAAHGVEAAPADHVLEESKI